MEPNRLYRKIPIIFLRYGAKIHFLKIQSIVKTNTILSHNILFYPKYATV